MNALITIAAWFALSGGNVAGGGGLIDMLVYLVIIALIFWLVWWFIGYVGIPEPFNKVIRVIPGLIALIILINFLLGLTGHGMNWHN